MVSQAYAAGERDMTEAAMQRLDKFLSEAGAASRKELKALLKAGAVRVNGTTVLDGAKKIDETADRITLNGETVQGFRTATVLMYKPAGFVTSTDEPGERTVMELLPEPYRRLKLLPVGRLDKQTEGVLLFTNDGALAHRLISPKYEVEKEYYARHAGEAAQRDVAAFAAGLTLRDGTRCRPAVLEPLGPGESHVVVTEGKYHQVRRMMASRGLPVDYLRRDREGSLTLRGLSPGQCRELTAPELAELP